METVDTKNGSREEHYTDLKEARVSAVIYSLEALNYARQFPISKQDEQDIYVFVDFARKLESTEFCRMVFSCKPIACGTAHRITISTLTGIQWQEASYLCKTLPTQFHN